jgi:hypothetical protein
LRLTLDQIAPQLPAEPPISAASNNKQAAEVLEGARLFYFYFGFRST